MAKFRWMAPFLVGFSSSPGIRDRERADYQRALSRVSEELSDYLAYSPRAKAGTEPFGWATASGAAQPWPFEVLRGTFKAKEITAHLDGMRLEDSFSWCLYDYGVFLVDGFLEVDEEKLSDPRKLEESIRENLTVVALECCTKILNRIRRCTNKIRGNYIYFQDTEVDAQEPLWVTRAYQLDKSDQNAVAFASSWISGVDEDNNREFESVIDGNEAQVARWMNHVHDASQPNETQWRWEALKVAQFFWASLQRVDENLRGILSESMADLDDLDLRAIRRQLSDTVNTAVELIMIQDEYRQYAPRTIKNKVGEFLQVWEYEEDLKIPAKTKLDLCQDRISRLSADQQERSAVTTDVILLGIGLTSLLATAVALVQFGRDASSDPNQSMFDLGNGAITAWLSSQSMDSVLLISLLASAVLMLVFFWKRRQGM